MTAFERNTASALQKIDGSTLLFELPYYSVNEISAYEPPREGTAWHLAQRMMNIPALWKQSRGETIKVAVLDTGINFIHAELKLAVHDAQEFSNSRAGIADLHGHGTHVAGIIAARENGRGVVGVAPLARLLIGKIADDQGRTSPDRLAAAIEWAVTAGADIINISYGSMRDEANTERLRGAIQGAARSGVFIICGAGDEGRDGVMYPAKYDECVAVGSLNEDGSVPNQSGQGAELDLVAPGAEIWSTYFGQGYACLSGTSMAAPFVSGVIALMLSKHRVSGGRTPVTTQRELLEHLADLTIPLGTLRPDPTNGGYGAIDPGRLIGPDPPSSRDGLRFRVRVRTGFAFYMGARLQARLRPRS